MERLVLLLVALVVSTHAGPLQTVSIDSCAKTCTDSSKFNYQPGSSYEYVYRANVRTLLPGTSAQETGLIMTATVNMDVLSKCELSMRLSDVKLEELDPTVTPTKDMTAGFAGPLEQFPVRISFQDGKVEHICPTAEEPTWVINVKRGVISMMQNNMDNLAVNKTVTETDVSGECQTSYAVQGSGWYTTTISKTKDLLGCKGRQGYNSAVRGIPYDSDSSIQSLPILKSKMECSHEVDTETGLLKRATCQEHHVFRPFSKADSGATTINNQELKYLRHTNGIRSPARIRHEPISLRFEHQNDVSQGSDPAKDLKMKLLEICQRTKTGVQPETPRLFTDLVYLVKSSDSSILKTMYDLLRGDRFCPDNQLRTRKFFLDSLPMAGTSAAVGLMTSLITTNTVTGPDAHMWITSLAFIKSPSQDMLREVKPLVNLPGYEDKALLSVGTLIHNYCQTQSTCDKDSTVAALVSAMENRMAKKCKVTPSTMKETVLVLRGLGNAGYVARAIPSLEACMMSPLTEIRLSAINAFRRMPCDANKQQLMRLFLDQEEDSEIRIAAYKALMQCPTHDILSKVKAALEQEQVNQVGSYVWTHLTNLMETSDRHKQDIRAILEDEPLKNSFDLDKRKFSRNYEGSFFLDALNTGAKLEGDLIWSSKSFIPRSSMVNLTVDLFGHSVNLLEVGGRVEGLEQLLETFFGPNGYFSQKATPATSDLVPKSVHPEKMKRINNRFGSTMEEMRGSMYMRVLGNELEYSSFDGLESLMTTSDFNLMEVMEKLAKDNDYTYSHSSMFLDSSIIIPTGSGFPMNLTVNGTSTVDLRLKGTMDLRNLPNVNINGQVKPSGAISISSMMSVDAFVTRPGIKMVSTLHSSTALQGRLTVRQDGTVSAEYQMPEPRMEIIDVRTSFFTIHSNEEREQPMSADLDKASLCSPQRLVTITGLELCAEVSYPSTTAPNAPYLPLAGPMSAGLYLNKRDTHTKYELNIKSLHDASQNVIHFSLDTPNSRVDRHILAEITLDKEKSTLDMALVSPWMKSTMQGSYTSDNGVTALNARASIDGRQECIVVAKMVKDRVGNAYRYTPSLEITMPQYKPISLRGMFMHNSNRQFDMEASINGLTPKPVSASVTINNRPALQGIKVSLDLDKNQQYSLDASLSTQETKKKIQFKPFISIRNQNVEVLSFGGTVSNVYGKKYDYNLLLDKVVEKEISMKGFVSQLAKRRGRVIYRTVMKMISSPIDLSWDFKVDNRNFNVIGTDFDLTYVIRRVARNNLKLVSKVQNLSSKQLTKAKTTMNFAVKRNPEMNMKLLSNVNHNKKLTSLDLDIRYGADFKDEKRHIDMAFEMNRNLQSLTEAEADISSRFRFPGMGLSMMMKGAHKHTPQDLDSSLEFRFGKNAPVQTSLRMWERWEKQGKVSAEYLLNYPGRDFAINHTLQGISTDKFMSTFNAQTQKGHKNTIITTIEIPAEERVKVMSDLYLDGYSPLHVEGDLQLNPQDFMALLALERNSRRYAGSVSSRTDLHQFSSLKVDLEHPDRRVIASTEGKMVNGVWHGEADFKWNAVRNDTERVHATLWMEPPTLDKLNASFALNYPTRSLKLSGHHIRGNKYLTGASVQWNLDQAVSANTVVAVNDGKVIAKAQLHTPFQSVQSVIVDLTHKDTSEEYNTDLAFNLNGEKSLSVETILKKPLSQHTLVATIKSQNNFASIKKVHLYLDHKLSNSLASSVKLLFNKQSIQTTITFQNTSKGQKVGVEGRLNVVSTFQAMKKAIIEFSHDNNGKTFNTKAKIMRNRKACIITSKISHIANDHMFENEGTIDLKMPSETYETAWTHKYTQRSIDTSYSTKWGKKNQHELAMKFNANFKDSFDTSLILDVPFYKIGNIQMDTSFMNEDKEANGKFKLLRNKEVVGSSEISYKLDETMAQAGASLAIPLLGVDSDLQTQFNNNDLSASMSAIITPEMTASLDITSGLVLWKSTFPGYEQIRWTYEIKDDKQLITIQTLEYGDGKTIRLQTSLQFERTEKKAHLDLTTPFEAMKKLSAGINILGNLESFQSDGYVEVLPVFNKISAVANYNTKSEVSGQLRLDTPFKNFEYFKTEFLGRLGGIEDLIKVQVEYQPSKIVKFELKNAKLSTFSTSLSVPSASLSYRHQLDKTSFESSAELELEDEKYSLGIDSKFSPEISSTVTLSMPSKRPVIVSFTHKGQLLNFEIHTQVQHNRKNSFDSAIMFNIIDKVNIITRANLRTELISDNEYSVAASVQGTINQFNIHSEFTTKSVGKSSCDISFSTEREISGSVQVVSPLIKNIKASFNQYYSSGFVQLRADLIHGGQKLFDVDASLKEDQSLVAELALQTPMTENLQGLVRFDGEKNSFAVHMEGSLGAKKAELEYISRLTPFQQSVTIKSTNMKDLAAELSLQTSPEYKGFAEFVYGMDRHRIDVTFSNSRAIEGAISLESPLVKSVSANFNINGKLNNFQSLSEFRHGGQKSKLQLSFRATGHIDGQLALNSPYMRSVTASFKHSGSLSDMQTEAKLALDSEEFDGKVTFTSLGKLSGALSLTTPYKEWREIKADISHLGGLRSFKSHGGYTLGRYISSIDLSFNSISKINGQLTINSHLIPDISISFDHNGSWRSFRCHGEVNLDGKKTEGDIDFTLEKDFILNMQLSVPDFEPINARLTHQGHFTDFKSHAELTYDTEKYQGDASLSINDKVSGHISWHLGSEMPDLEVIIEHTMSPSLKSHAEMKYGDDQTVWDIVFSHSSKEIASTLTLTSSYFNDIEFNLMHKIPIQKQISSHVDMRYGTDKLAADYALQWSHNALTCTMSFSSPYTDEVTVKINHDGPVNSFITKADVTVGSEHSTGEASFKLEDKSVVSNVNVKTETLDLVMNLKHNGDLPKFTTHADISIDGTVRELDVNVNVIDDIYMTASLMAPEFSFKANHNGSPLNFRSFVAVTKSEETFSARANLQTTDEVEASLFLTSPVPGHESYRASYTHKGASDRFHCHLEVHTPTKSSISDFDVSNKAITLDISYPEIRVKVSNEILTGQKLESAAELNVLGNTFSSAINFENETSQWKGKVEMKSSFEAYSLFRLAGTLSKSSQIEKLGYLELVLNDDHNEIEASLRTDSKLEGSLSVKTTVLPHINIKANLQGSMPNVKTSTELLLDGEKKGSLQAVLDLANQQTVSVDIETPFENFTTMGASLTFKVKDVSNIDTSVMMTLEGDKIIDAGVKFTIGPKIEGEARFDSVYLHPVTASVSFEKVLHTYTVSSDLTHNGDNLLTINGQVTYPEDLLNTEGSIQINPYFMENFVVHKIDIVELSVTSKKTLQNLNTQVGVKINRDKWEVKTGYLSDRDMNQATFTLSRPDTHPLQGSVTFKNKFSRYIVSANLELDSANKYEYDMNVRTRNGLKASISLITPIDNMEKTTISLDFEGNFPNIKYDASVEYSGKKLAASAILSHSAEKSESTLTIVTPFEGFEKIESRLFREGVISNLKAGGKLDYTTGEAIEVTLEHLLAGSTLKSKATFTSPFTNTITVTADHSGPLDDFTSAFELSFGPDNGLKLDTTFKTSPRYLHLLSSLETTMTGETSKQTVEVRHEGGIENFNCEAKLQYNSKTIQLNAAFQLDPVIEGSLSLITPFSPVEEIKASFSHSGDASTFLTTGEVQYAPRKKISGKVNVLVQDISRMEMSAELKTPFSGYEESKISYHHSGSMSNFNCETSLLFATQEISSILAGKISPPNFSLNMRTPFEGYKNIDMKFNFNKDKLGHCNTRLEGTWSPGKTVVTELTLSNMHNKLEASGVLSTPFDIKASFEFSNQIMQGSVAQTLKASLNDKSIVDIETDLDLLKEHKHAKIITRAPLAMKYEVEGDFTLQCVDVSATANWDTKDTGKLVHFECGYDIRQDNTAHLKLTGLGQSISYTGKFLIDQMTSELTLDMTATKGRYGFDLSRKGQAGMAKILLPQRTVEISGSTRPGLTTGALLWDADNDRNKAVEFRSVIIPSSNSMKSEITVRLPSLRKEVKLRSQAVVNRGRVIFDGKLELDYSQDSSQKLLLSTSLEDISTGPNTNYSFSIGVSHPYSTVGIRLASHVGKSQDQYSAGMGLEYLTARRQTKTFQVGAMLNKLRKSAKLELQSPVKSISIASSLQTEDDFQVTLTNTYDKRRPISTTFTFSPSRKSIELTTNYDLDNPSSSYNVLARYVNSSAVEAKAFRMVGSKVETDMLLAARLNNSQLLHTRLHWRPELLQDLKAYQERKVREYRARTSALMAEVETAVLEEAASKAELIWDVLEEEMGPDAMAALEKHMYPLIRSGARAVQSALSQAYSQYLLNPRANLAQTPQVKNLPIRYIPNQMPYMPSLKIGMLFDSNQPREKFQVVRQTVTNVLPSNTFTDLLLSVIDREVELAARDLASIHFDWDTTVYDPENGEIQVEFHLPIPLASLDAMPVVNLEKYLRRMRQVLPGSPSKAAYKPDLTTDWLPPFTGVATISKGHRISTFDGYVYDLPVDCTLILAKDFRDGNFTLILSNEGDTSLTLLAGSKTVEINLDGQVMVDGKEPKELPVTMDGLQISKEGDMIQISSASLLDITYDTSVDHITIRMNGWYFGKTGGLLGTYDNEPSNDLTTSFGKVNSNEARFAKTWDVGHASC